MQYDIDTEAREITITPETPDELAERIRDVNRSLLAMLRMADVLHAAARTGSEAHMRRVAAELGFLTHSEAVHWCYGCIDADRLELAKLRGEEPSPSLADRAA